MNIATFTTCKAGSNKDKVQVKIKFSFDYKAVLQSDLAKAQSLTPEQVLSFAAQHNIPCTLDDCTDALTGTKHGRTGIITSIQTALNEDPTAPSKSQIYEAHPTIAGVKVSLKTRELYCTGILLEETIIEKDPNPDLKKPVNSGVVVQLKNLISKIIKFDKDKIRTYKLDSLDSYQTFEA
jgi:hypothetical protein